ncbi:MAG: methionine biosynthesis protein MetW [Kiritimatiellia bacterium]|nr:methionine biosynthesis protein MetW [Kiritimatiellia bacterium]
MKRKSPPGKQPSTAESRAAVIAATAAILRRLDPALEESGLGVLADGVPPEILRWEAGDVEDHSRWQDAVLEREIPRGAKLLDLGCGRGELLARLIREGGVRGQGVELDADSVVECVGLGVPVLQMDLDQGLKEFPNRSFDYVLLEDTLQTLHKPLEVLKEMLRVGRHGIVSFPNFGSWRVRLSLSLTGRMPVTERLPHRWFDTPNIHLFTLQDFLDWTESDRVRVVQGFVFAAGEVRLMRPDDNLVADEALLFLTRDPQGTQ